ncbi:hypothetical protein MRX96_043745, partial [Rhipicephalus microplus]
REKPKLRVGAIPRIFENLPAYLTKPKPRSRSQRENPPAKRRRVSSPNNDGTAASVSSSTEPCDPEAAGDDGVVISTGKLHRDGMPDRGKCLLHLRAPRS